MTGSRRAELRQLLSMIREVRPGGRALVAIDGLDGAGKTVLAEELVELAAEDSSGSGDNRLVASLSIDGFHHPRAVRYARGKGPESFFHDSYDYDAFIRSVVTPFREGTPIIPAVWDVNTDAPAAPARAELPPRCVLLVEGIFLHRPELRTHWDASVWVEVPFEVSVPRGNVRFPGQHDSIPEAAVNHRYVGGQRLYLAECSPWEWASWIFDNEDLQLPRLRTHLPRRSVPLD